MEIKWEGWTHQRSRGGTRFDRPHHPNCCPIISHHVPHTRCIMPSCISARTRDSNRLPSHSSCFTVTGRLLRIRFRVPLSKDQYPIQFGGITDTYRTVCDGACPDLVIFSTISTRPSLKFEGMTLGAFASTTAAEIASLVQVNFASFYSESPVRHGRHHHNLEYSRAEKWKGSRSRSKRR